MGTQLVDIELRGVDDPVGDGTDGLQAATLSTQRRTHGRIGAEGMGATSLAVAANQRRVGGLEIDHHGRDHAANRFHDGGQFLELGALADIDDERGAAGFE